MIQLYFLSILCNALCGFILFAGIENPSADNTRFSINNPTFYLVLGIVTLVTGVLKLLSPVLEKVYILGDLVPAVAGIVAGIVIISGFSRKEKTTEEPKSGTLDNFAKGLLAFRKPLGITLLAVALIHFLFPKLLFL